MVSDGTPYLETFFHQDAVDLLVRFVGEIRARSELDFALEETGR